MAVESQIGKQIREVLGTSLRRDPASIKPEHHLRDDLGLDSLMTFELLYDLEKAFDLEIPNDDLPGLQTLDDVVKYVEHRVGPNGEYSTTSTTEKTATAKKPGKAAPSTKTKSATPTKAKKSAAPPKSRKSSTPPKSRATAAQTKRVPSTATAKKQGSSKSKAKKS